MPTLSRLESDLVKLGSQHKMYLKRSNTFNQVLVGFLISTCLWVVLSKDDIEMNGIENLANFQTHPIGTHFTLSNPFFFSSSIYPCIGCIHTQQLSSKPRRLYIFPIGNMLQRRPFVKSCFIKIH